MGSSKPLNINSPKCRHVYDGFTSLGLGGAFRGVLRWWDVGVAYRRRQRRRDWRCLRLAIEPGDPGQPVDPVGAKHRRDVRGHRRAGLVQ
jgi:hypothetical protein